MILTKHDNFGNDLYSFARGYRFRFGTHGENSLSEILPVSPMSLQTNHRILKACASNSVRPVVHLACGGGKLCPDIDGRPSLTHSI